MHYKNPNRTYFDKVTKLYVNRMPPYHLAFLLAKWDVHIEHIKPLTNLSYIAFVSYKFKSSIDGFIQSHPQRAKRLFKSAKYKAKADVDSIKGLAYNSVNNLLHFIPNDWVVRINASHKYLKDMFYNAAVDLNEKNNLGFTFDFDTYDVELYVRRVMYEDYVWVLTWIEPQGKLSEIDNKDN